VSGPLAGAGLAKAPDKESRAAAKAVATMSEVASGSSDGGISKPAAAMTRQVATVGSIGFAKLQELLRTYGLNCEMVAPGESIPGTYWGESEAGLLGSRLYVRGDTPLHSALHEACHFVCMDGARRTALARDAGGDFAEENAVCYLQVVLAGCLPAMGRERMWADMDSWGYTFRLQSARRWFEEDAEEVLGWLVANNVLTAQAAPTWQLRGS
jgi:hypothetical protein